MRFFLISIFITTVLLISPVYTLAQTTVMDGSLRATFSSVPLFTSPNPFAPGMGLSASTTLENSGTVTEDVLFGVENQSSTGLADRLIFTIKSGGSTLYEDTLQNFFTNAPHTLDTLNANASKLYDLEVTFASSSDDTYQGGTAGFDLLVGFAGGASVTSGTGGGGSSPSSVTNNPPGEVAGAATSGESYTDDNFWPWWDGVTASLVDMLRPDDKDDAQLAGSATTSDSVVDPVVGANGNVAGMLDDNDLAEEFCILLWFILLALLGVAGRYSAASFAGTNNPTLSRYQLAYLVFSGVYLISLYILATITNITTGLGWTLFIVWLLYQLYDYFIVWRQAGELNKLRSMVLLAGLLMLFLLPAWVGWLCVWW